MSRQEPKRIDVHHHYNPQIYTDALYKYTAGQGASGRLMPVNKWTMDMTLEIMDELQIDISILSTTDPGVAPIVRANREDGIAVCRKINEEAADLIAKDSRFGVFATLPFPDMEAVVAEADYALGTLKLDGVGIMSNYGASIIGDPEYDELFDVLNKHNAVVFIHPSMPVDEAPRACFVPFDPMMEFCFQTTRAAANLIFGGTLERCPNIKFVLSHTGGTLPYLAWRLSTTYSYFKEAPLKNLGDDLVLERWSSLKKDPMDYIKSFYFDTALSCSKTQIEGVRNLDESHLMFGTDAHYAPRFVGKMMTKFIDEYQGYDDKYHEALNRTNAYALFPRFAKG
ncbi:amidohydrolase [Selenomonadales bacterium OttesenSCG-928-I06]|nr:amidohydrolase [Selenomonadales bacterium OttesenSCG-928-I06]